MTNELVFDCYVDKLKKSPIYAMSLGSKELFHPNFWAWLIEGDNKFAQVFFENMFPCENLEVEREQGNRDLTIWHNGKAYVIENKLKSIPSKEQLEKYQKDLGESFGGGVLTGIIEPIFLLQNNNWKFISYGEISKKLLEKCNESKEDIIQRNRCLIEEYCEILEMISTLLKGLFFNEDIFIYRQKEINKLHNVGLDSIYKKLCAEKFAAYFLSNIKQDVKPVDGYELCIWTHFFRNQAGIDIRYEMKRSETDIRKDDSRKGITCIGVQIEGSQFRIMVQCELSNAYTSGELFEMFSDEEIGWFEKSFDKESNKKIWDIPTTMKPKKSGKKDTKDANWDKYNGYITPPKYTLIYQYYDIDLYNNGESYRELSNSVLKALEKAKASIEKYNIKYNRK